MDKYNDMLVVSDAYYGPGIYKCHKGVFKKIAWYNLMTSDYFNDVKMKNKIIYAISNSWGLKIFELINN